MTPTYDVVIVGGGPSGVAFAKTLISCNANAKVLLLERYEHPREKICGDGLSPISLELIAQIFPELLDVIPAKSIARNFTVWYPNGACLSRTTDELAVVPRQVLDGALWDTLRGTSIELMQGVRVTDLLIEHSRVVGVRACRKGKRIDIQAALVVGADGSTSVVRRKTSTGRKETPGMAIRQYVRGIPHTDDRLTAFLDPHNMGYFWIFPIWRADEWWANIGYFQFGNKRVNISERFRSYCESPLVKRYLGEAKGVDKPKGFPLNLPTMRFNRIVRTRPLAGPGYLLIGDAAGLINPNTGEGISMALYSGKCAAELYAQSLSEQTIHRRYEEEMLCFANSSFAVLKTTLAVRLPCILPRPLSWHFMKWIPKLYPQKRHLRQPHLE